MEYNSNTKEVLARLIYIRALIASGVFSDVLVAGLNAAMGAMKRRIFNQSLDALGNSLGPYFSEQYARDRRREGRQTARKDLEFSGTLRRSIEVVAVENNRAEIRITNPEEVDIARKQEQMIFNLLNNLPFDAYGSGKVPIFELSDLEAEIARTTTRELLAEKLNF